MTPTLQRLTTVVAALIASVAGALCQPAEAAVGQADDAAFGAKALVQDQDHLMDWLRLDFTTPYTFNQVVGLLDPGDLFAGWHIASNAELSLLGSAAGIVHGSTDPAIVAKAEQLRDWLCFACVALSSTHEYARGLTSDSFVYDPGTGPQTVQDAFSVGRRFNVTPAEADFRVSGFYYQNVKQSPDEGIWLTRATAPVPEPGTYALMALGLAGLTLLRRRQHRA